MNTFDNTSNDKFIVVTRNDWGQGKLKGDYTLTFTQRYIDGKEDSYPVVVIASLKHQPEDLLRKCSRARNQLRSKATGRKLVQQDGLTLEDYVKQLEAKV